MLAKFTNNTKAVRKFEKIFYEMRTNINMNMYKFCNYKIILKN